MTFTMTLLPPVGSTVAEIGYTARVEDVVIPRATVSIAVVQPLKNPSLSTAAASYQGGADTGATLTAGAEQIDSNLLKLRDGAGDPARRPAPAARRCEQLNDGLAGEAAPGANKLAAGAGDAANGAGRAGRRPQAAPRTAAVISPTVSASSPTATRSSRRASTARPAPQDLVSGSQDLAAGLGLISGGLPRLAGVEGLPKAYAGLQTLR